MAEVEELKAKGRSGFESADAAVASLEKESAKLAADEKPAP